MSFGSLAYYSLPTIDVTLFTRPCTPELLYPNNVLYSSRCWAPGGAMPTSMFCFTPFRPTNPGPVVYGARQLGPLCGPTCLRNGGCSGLGAPAGVPVNNNPAACASGRTAAGLCL